MTTLQNHCPLYLKNILMLLRKHLLINSVVYDPLSKNYNIIQIESDNGKNFKKLHIINNSFLHATI